MKVGEGLRIQGKIKINAYRAGMVDAVTPLLQEIKALRAIRREPGDFRRNTVATLKREIERIKAEYFLGIAVETRNLIMDSPGYGLDLLIQRLVGINTYSGNIQWIEIGTGTATPTVNDTGLTTPSIRLAVSYQEDFGTTEAVVQAYVSDANLPNGAYSEVGSFVDGTSSIGSGQIFNHALLSPTYSKVSGQDTTIEVDISIMNS